MNSVNDGGPAFPLPEHLTWPGHDSHGASLRDIFAGFALIAIQSDPGHEAAAPIREMPFSTQAATAFKLADAMLQARDATIPAANEGEKNG